MHKWRLARGAQIVKGLKNFVNTPPPNGILVGTALVGIVTSMLCANHPYLEPRAKLTNIRKSQLMFTEGI